MNWPASLKFVLSCNVPNILVFLPALANTLAWLGYSEETTPVTRQRRVSAPSDRPTKSKERRSPFFKLFTGSRNQSGIAGQEDVNGSSSSSFTSTSPDESNTSKRGSVRALKNTKLVQRQLQNITESSRIDAEPRSDGSKNGGKRADDTIPGQQSFTRASNRVLSHTRPVGIIENAPGDDVDRTPVAFYCGDEEELIGKSQMHTVCCCRMIGVWEIYAR